MLTGSVISAAGNLFPRACSFVSQVITGMQICQGADQVIDTIW